MASNQLLTISMITAESARVLGNNIVLGKCVNRDYDNDFAIKGAKIGQNLNVRKPARYSVRTGSVVNIEAQTETYAPLTFVDPYGVDLSFTSQELTFSLDDFSSRVVKPAVIAIANYVDSVGFQLVDQTFNSIGTPGTAITASSTLAARDAVLQAAARLYDNDAPVEDGQLHLINSSNFNAVLAGSNASLFNPSKEISDIYVKGMQGVFGGFNVYMDQLAPTHTVGTYTALGTTSASPQTGSTVNSTGWTSGGTTLNKGDLVTFAGVYAVNPQTKASYGWLQEFVITATISDTTGSIAIPVSPAIVASGPFQNVSTPPNSSAVTVIGASTKASQQSIGFHKDAFMLANQELVLPMGVESAAYVRDTQTDIGLRVVSQYDIRTNQHITRFDTMVAWAVLYPQLCTRIFTS
jgi:hypothetical protein